ncbi:MAG TPA: class I SAM-dependent methyltransferase [Cytophagaceae bacterium]|jgi:ubiquinone/menaquinone biosynthesis C-methylase UbiE
METLNQDSDIMNSDLISYYKNRASEYEKIYSKPERQEELLMIEKELEDIFQDKEVLEVACGTGYWTQKIASSASSIIATDINEAVIDVAKSKDYAPATVDSDQPLYQPAK